MFLLLLLLATALLSFYNFYWKRRHLPPGPTPWPLIGNILTLSRSKRFEDKFCEWSQQYGPTFTYWQGEMPVVAICDYQDMTNCFVKQADVFSDRLNKPFTLFRKGDYGIIMKNGEVWREHRRFALKVLRDFGLGKNQMEERILAELDDVIRKTDSIVGTGEIDYFKYTDVAVGSIINAIISGYRYSEDKEEEFYNMKDLNEKMMRSFQDIRVVFAISYKWLQDKPFFKERLAITTGYMYTIIDYLNSQVQEHLKNNDYTQDFEANDFIDAYLLEREKRIQKDGEEGSFDIYQLTVVAFDLWLAGQETTSHTITWIIAYLIRHPEVQEKLQKELDSVIGSKRIIRNSDRPNLPYTNAVIMESQRCCNLLSQNLLREVTEDVEVSGYKLKKGTIVVPQISVLLQNPKVFPHPSRFNPSRFMDENGKLKQVDELIPFSIGKRICLGEGMARMELFIFTANLFNQYKFSAGKVAPTLEKAGPSAMATEPYKCVVERR